MQTKLYIDSFDENCSLLIKDFLSSNLKYSIKQKRNIVILCIGSDRSTGDSLGPLIGSKLKQLEKENLHIFGTLENPIHANNLESTLNQINSTINKPIIIAIDACLSSLDKVGYIILKKAPIEPGAALNKQLPCVGELSILGVVNISSDKEFITLQNTRLFTVIKIANSITQGIESFFYESFESTSPYNYKFTLKNI